MKVDPIIELGDRETIQEFLMLDPGLHLYELGDLGEFFWPHCRWFSALNSGRTRDLALLYKPGDAATLLALTSGPAVEMLPLVNTALAAAGGEAYSHLPPALEGGFPARAFLPVAMGFTAGFCS